VGFSSDSEVERRKAFKWVQVESLVHWQGSRFTAFQPFSTP